MSSAKRSSSHDADLNDLDDSAKRQKNATSRIEEEAIEVIILEESESEETTFEEPHASSMAESIIEELAIEEAGRRAMIAALESEFDKLYSDFDLIFRHMQPLNSISPSLRKSFEKIVFCLKARTVWNIHQRQRSWRKLLCRLSGFHAQRIAVAV
jgi:hypothetical protein